MIKILKLILVACCLALKKCLVATIISNPVYVGSKGIMFTLKVDEFYKSDVNIKVSVGDEFLLSPSLRDCSSRSNPVCYIETYKANKLDFTLATFLSVSHVSGSLALKFGYFDHKTSSRVKPFNISIANSSTQEVLESFPLDVSLIYRNLTDVKLTPEQKTASLITNLLVSFTPNSLPRYGDNIVLTFPQWNPGAPAPLKKSAVSTSSLCFGLKGLNYNLQCSLTNDSLEIFTGDFIENPENLIVINITNFRNPSSMKGLTNISVEVKAQNGGIYDVFRSGQVLITSPGIPKYVTFQSSSTEIRQMTDFTFSILPSAFLEINSELEIQFPSEIDVSNAGVSGLENLFIGKLKATYDSLLNVLKISNINNEYVELKAIKLIVSNIRNPLLSGELTLFGVTIRTADGFVSEQVKAGLSYSPTNGLLRNLEVTPLNKSLGAITNYKISFTSPIQYFPETDIKIIFPIDTRLGKLVRQKCSGLMPGLSLDAECAISDQEFTVYKAFPPNFPGGLVWIVVPQVKNPPSSVSNGSLYISTLYNTRILDESETSVSIRCQPGSFENLAIGTSHLVVNVLATYKFVFNLQNFFPAGAFFELTFPSDYSKFFKETISNNLVTAWIVINNNTNTTLTASIDPPSHIIRLTFLNTTQTLESSTKLELTLTNIINPRTLKPTGSFNLTTRINEGFIDVLKAPANVEMRVPSSLNNITISLESSVLGGTSNLVISFDMKNTLTEGDRVELMIPDYLKVSQIKKEKCAIVGLGNLSLSLACNFSIESNSLIFIFPSNSSGSVPIKFTVVGLTNPVSPAEKVDSKLMVIRLLTSENVTIGLGLFTDLQFKFTPATISYINLTPDNLALGNRSSLKLILKLNNSLPVASVLVVNLPQEFSVALPKALFQGVELQVTLSPKNILTINLRNSAVLPEGTFLDILLSGFENLGTKTNLQAVLRVFLITGSSDQYLLQQGSLEISWSFFCHASCKNCEGKYSNCIECESGRYLLDNSCISSCSDQDNLVVRERNICLKCKTSRSNCKRCFPLEPEGCAECLEGFEYAKNTNTFCIQSNQTDNTTDSGNSSHPVENITNVTNSTTVNNTTIINAVGKGCLIKEDLDSLAFPSILRSHIVFLYAAGFVLIIVLVAKIFLRNTSIVLAILVFWSLLFEIMLVFLILKLVFLQSWFILILAAVLAFSKLIHQIVSGIIINKLLSTDPDFLLASGHRGINCLMFYLIYFHWQTVLFYFGNPGYCIYFRFTNKIMDQLAKKVLLLAKIDLGLTGVFIFVMILFLAMVGQGSECLSLVLSFYEGLIFGVLLLVGTLLGLYFMKNELSLIKAEAGAGSGGGVNNMSGNIEIHQEKDLERGADVQIRSGNLQSDEQSKAADVQVQSTTGQRISKLDKSKISEIESETSHTIFKKETEVKEHNFKAAFSGTNNKSESLENSLDGSMKKGRDRDEKEESKEESKDESSAGPSVGYSVEKRPDPIHLWSHKEDNPANKLKRDEGGTDCEKQEGESIASTCPIKASQGRGKNSNEESTKNVISPFSHGAFDEKSLEMMKQSDKFDTFGAEKTANSAKSLAKPSLKEIGTTSTNPQKRVELHTSLRANREGNKVLFVKTCLEEISEDEDASRATTNATREKIFEKSKNNALRVNFENKQARSTVIFDSAAAGDIKKSTTGNEGLFLGKQSTSKLNSSLGRVNSFASSTQLQSNPSLQSLSRSKQKMGETESKSEAETIEKLNSFREKQEQTLNDERQKKKQLNELFSTKANSIVLNSLSLEEDKKMTTSFSTITSDLMEMKNLHTTKVSLEGKPANLAKENSVNPAAKNKADTIVLNEKSISESGHCHKTKEATSSLDINQLKLSTSNSPWKMASMAMQRQKIQLNDAMVECRVCGDQDRVKYCERCKNAGYCDICRNCTNCSGFSCSSLKINGSALSKKEQIIREEKGKISTKPFNRAVETSGLGSYEKMQIQNWIRDPGNSSGTSSELSIRQFLSEKSELGVNPEENLHVNSKVKSKKTHLVYEKSGDLNQQSADEISEESSRKFFKNIRESLQKNRNGFF